MAINLTNEQYHLFYRIVSNNVPSNNKEVWDMRWIFEASRPWFNRETGKYPLHPAVHELLHAYDGETKSGAHNLRHYITDWREMMLEWPHISMTDPARLAYTQSDDKGRRDQQTLTTLNKYLRKHMPQCPDHTLRDFCALYTVDVGACGITTDMETMLRIVETGPKSCMQGFKDTDRSPHPYRVYDPKFGWGMAYRESPDGGYLGRAVVNMADGEKIFVRSYKKRSEGYSQADEVLEAYLKGQGFKHVDSWYDKKLAMVEDSYGCARMVYLDGGSDWVQDCGDHWLISDEGDYCADRTDGVLGERGVVCDDCGGHYDEDDMTTVGYYGDHSVCEGCLHDGYTLAHGRGGEQYYVPAGDAVYCESDDEYYHGYYLDRYDVVWVESADGYYLIDDTWECAGSNELYTNDVPSYEIDGEYYHKNYLPDGWEVVDGQLRHVDADLEEAA